MTDQNKEWAGFFKSFRVIIRLNPAHRQVKAPPEPLLPLAFSF